MKRSPIRPSVRFRVLERDGFACRYCGSVPPYVVLQVDHVIPVAEGGGNEESNLVVACRDCNIGKRDRIIEAVPDDGALSALVEERTATVLEILTNRFGPLSEHERIDVESAVTEITCSRMHGFLLLREFAKVCARFADWSWMAALLWEEPMLLHQEVLYGE